MNRAEDAVETALAGLAEETSASAPKAATPAVIRILADRRRAAAESRRFLALLAMASAMTPLLVLTSCFFNTAVRGLWLPAAALLASVMPSLASAAGGLGSLLEGASPGAREETR